MIYEIICFIIQKINYYIEWIVSLAHFIDYLFFNLCSFYKNFITTIFSFCLEYIEKLKLEWEMKVIEEIKLQCNTSSTQNLVFNALYFIFQTFFFIILMVWARAAGPRLKIDQLTKLSWKDYFLTLSFISCLTIYIYIFF